MFTSFAQIEAAITSSDQKKCVAVANAHDADTLESVVFAKRKGIIRALLIGDQKKITTLLGQMGEDLTEYELVHEEDSSRAAMIACDAVKSKQADIPMKGLMQTSDFIKAVLNKTYGFLPDQGLLAEASVFEYQERLMVVSDCAVNLEPAYNDKMKITKNAVALSKLLGNHTPKVAVVAPVETINPKMQSTLDAAMLVTAARRGQIKDCILDGPLALDNALSRDAALHKGIQSEVAGEADVLLMPDLCSGNIFLKTMIYMGNIPSSSNIIGTKVPVIMTSRTDFPENKYHSILIAVLQSMGDQKNE